MKFLAFGCILQVKARMCLSLMLPLSAAAKQPSPKRYRNFQVCNVDIFFGAACREIYTYETKTKPPSVTSPQHSKSRFKNNNTSYKEKPNRQIGTKARHQQHFAAIIKHVRKTRCRGSPNRGLLLPTSLVAPIAERTTVTPRSPA